MHHRLTHFFLLACTAILGLASPSFAVIMRLVPLSELEKEQFIFVAKVAEVLPDKPAMVLVPDENLKGKVPFDRMPVNLTGSAEAKKGKHTEVLLDRIEKDTPIVIAATTRGRQYTAFGFTNGTWFQLEGRIEKADGKDVVRWSFLQCEPYLRRTFKGTTEELKQIVVDALAKKKAAPEPDEKEPPGFGPAIKKKSGLDTWWAATRSVEDVRSHAERGDEGGGGVARGNEGARGGAPTYPLAVIQLPFIGLIAALAALFPTVFGGLALFMKRWVAALSTAGLVSLFACAPLIFPGWTARQWFFSPSGLWLTSAGFFAVGALWSLRRYRRSIETGTSEIMQPGKFDRLLVALLFVAGIIALAVGLSYHFPVWTNDYWRWTLAATAGLGATTYYLLTCWRRLQSTLRVPGEAVLLWTIVACCIAFGAWESGRYSQRNQVVAQGGLGQPGLALNADNTLADPLWSFAPKDLTGTVVNSCATPDRVYVAVTFIAGFNKYAGRIYALDSNTGKELWQFDNDFENNFDERMMAAFSAPVFDNGRLYFGEGLHFDKNARLFCLDAETGKKLWEYKTESHTESTPFVAEGRVVIGAGYHGLHCVDAVTGEFQWRYPKDAKADDMAAHVDCNPVIAGGRVYAGSGYKPDYVKNDGKINTIFCLDLASGEERWKHRVEDSVYGSPLVHDGKVFYGMGNSTYSEPFESKRPGITCRDAGTGEVVWERILPDGVVARSSADKLQLFVGCLDGNAYALDLRSGQINWTINLGGAVLAQPVVELDKDSGTADVVYFLGKFGTMTAASPYSGRIFWSVPLSYWTRTPVEDASATPTIVRLDDENELRRRFYVGFGQGRANAGVPRMFCIEEVTKKK